MLMDFGNEFILCIETICCRELSSSLVVYVNSFYFVSLHIGITTNAVRSRRVVLSFVSGRGNQVHFVFLGVEISPSEPESDTTYGGNNGNNT